MKYTAICPYCNKKLNIDVGESGGEKTVTLSYSQNEANREELEAHGYEFGEHKSKLIFNAGIARKLVQLGNKIIDIKPQKENQDKTTFVFEYTDKFAADLRLFSE